MKKDHSPFTCDGGRDRKQGGNGIRKDRPGFLLADLCSLRRCFSP